MAAIEAVDLEDADALDLLHRLDALADDALDAFEQPAAEQRGAGGVGQHILGFVERTLGLGFANIGGHLNSLTSNIAELSSLLFTRMLLPFEVTSVLILVAILGAVVLARKEQ